MSGGQETKEVEHWGLEPLSNPEICPPGIDFLPFVNVAFAHGSAFVRAR